MDLESKLDILAPAARFEACDQHHQPGRRYRPAKANKATWDDRAIDAEAGPPGRALPTMRLLMSSRCEWDCPYCPLRSATDAPRAALEPEELAQAVLPRIQRGAAQGVLLSTGVDGDARRATQRMLDGVEHLRTKARFDGYLHLKLLPGSTRDEVERAVRLGSRLSINIEAPTAERLAQLSPKRDWYADVIGPLIWARDWQRAGLLPSGIATQFVVGASGESDRELLDTTAWLYRSLELRRVYFGAFRPIPGTPLAENAPTPLVREQRLKEADWLLRHYGFENREMPYDTGGNLPLGIDPKLAWAIAHPERFPVEINTADATLLMRVPGLGPVSASRIIRLRQQHRFREPQQLRGLGAIATRAIDFVLLDGRFFGRDSEARARHYTAPQPPVAEQLSLW